MSLPTIVALARLARKQLSRSDKILQQLLQKKLLLKLNLFNAPNFFLM